MCAYPVGVYIPITHVVCMCIYIYFFSVGTYTCPRYYIQTRFVVTVAVAPRNPRKQDLRGIKNIPADAPNRATAAAAAACMRPGTMPPRDFNARTRRARSDL